MSCVGMKRSCVWEPITMRKRLTSRTLPSPSGRPNMLTLLPISHLLHCYTVTCNIVALLHASASAGHIPPLTRLLHSHCYKLVSSTHTYPVLSLNIYLCWNTPYGNVSSQLNNTPPLLLRHWYEIMALYYVKLILTEISASRQDRRVLQKSKIIRIEFLSKWGMLQTSRYV